MKDTDIAIVGMSGVYPDARTVDQLWDNLVNEVDSIIEAPADRIDPMFFEYDKNSIADRYYCNKGGFITPGRIDPAQYGLLPIAAEGMDPEHLLVLDLVYRALEDAQIFQKNISLKKCSLIIGKGNYSSYSLARVMDIVNTAAQIVELVKNLFPNIPPDELDKVRKAFQAEKGRYQPDTAIGNMPNLIASIVSNKLDMQGPAYTVDAACASSLIALDNSIQGLLSGQCDIAITGGVYVGQCASFWSTFSLLGALSRKQQITPFSEDADGLLVGEAASFVVLKKLSKAIAEKDRIYAVIKGIGVSSDGGGLAPMVPSTKGQKRAVELAWEMAGIDTDRIGYVEAHGTATVVGDKTELKSLAEVFVDKPGLNKILLGSVKSNIGHTMPAAGLTALIKTALALYYRKIPKTLHCENPLKMMEETRFRPVQELTDWDDSVLPTVAGVNAFGFGGINAHVVLEAYGEKGEPINVYRDYFPDKVVAISATSKPALLKMLDDRNYSINQAGKYRLVIFNPTDERIEKAKMLIAKDKPWKGKLDIWYSNEPLLKEGGKVAFAFPGFGGDFSTQLEVDSVIEYFKLSRDKTDIVDDSEMDELSREMVKLYRSQYIIDNALKRVGVIPDMNFGHSLGEWSASVSSNLYPEEEIKTMAKNIVPGEDYNIDGIKFIVVGCGSERVNQWLQDIPDLYLSNDNCPNQVMLCGTNEATEKLLDILKKEQIYYHIPPYASGFHSPFAIPILKIFRERSEGMQISKMDIPLWSAATLERYPEDFDGLMEHMVEHFSGPVKFRQLVQKLYDEEEARVFIQIGNGSLTAFIDDTLKDKQYSAISTYAPNKSTIEQLRRVLALLFIEGRAVDQGLMGVDLIEKGVMLKANVDIVRDFPLLRGLIQKYAPNMSSTGSVNTKGISTPLMYAINENLHEMMLVQNEMIELFEKLPKKAASDIQNNTVTPQQEKQNESLPVQNNSKLQSSKNFEERLYIDLKDFPYVIDHTIVKQPSHWEHWQDLNYVVPMTMSIELLSEIANKQDPSKKIVQLNNINVYQWIIINKPFDHIIKGSWKTDNTVSLTVKDYLSGEFTLGDTFPEVPAEFNKPIDLGEVIKESPTIESVYEEYMFHGPAYQGIIEVKEITKKGIRVIIQQKGGKGSLLDCLGQTIGLYLQLILPDNAVSFPVKIDEIKFYQDMKDTDGVFECYCILDELTEEFGLATFVLKRDNKVWCVSKGWVNRRLTFDTALWKTIVWPDKYEMAKEIAPGVFYYGDFNKKPVGIDFMMRQFLNYQEKEVYNSIPLNKRKEYVLKHAVMKDSVRNFISKQTGNDNKLFPIEFFFKKDEHGKPYVYGPTEAEGLEISVGHKGYDIVAITSDKPVGIDIETIEERSQSFIEISFTKKELSMLDGLDNAEWTTRFWVAKEAYSKKLGTGLQGNPKQLQFEIDSIDGDILTIGDTKIQTMIYDKFIVGWTIN